MGFVINSKLEGSGERMSMNKCYGLYIIKDKDSFSSDVVAVSNDPNKLRPFTYTNTFYIGTYDITNSKEVAWYTDMDKCPYWVCKELPYVC